MFGAMNFIYNIKRSIATKADSLIWAIDQQHIAYYVLWQAYAVPSVDNVSQASINMFGGPSEYVPSGAQFSEASAKMCQVVHNFRRLLRICARWCTTFGGLCEYVSSGAQLSEASANMCQMVHNFWRSLRICAKWCSTFGVLCECVPSGVQLSGASANM